MHPAMTEEAAHRARLQRALGDAWQITRLIGRGGFAEVYAVLDVNLRREVAVKTLRHDIEVSAQMIQRFKREAESVARLRHPNIVPIYQVGEGEGLVYFIMPVIEGESLAASVVRGESFSIAETCRVLREVAAALGAAHRTGVVHRDVKPDNIMLEGPERRAVVMDFGIAKLADAAEARLTGTGLLIGSPHYMSPEQAAGESELDHRSDEYSLAVVGYQMVAGRMPFDSTSVQSILFKQMTETAPPIETIRPDVPPALSAALARALSKKPEDRYQSMEEFAAAIPAPGGGGQASVRRTLDARARAVMARETLAKWRWAALAAAVIGVAGTAAVYRATVPAQSIAVASQRQDAVFAAKPFLPPMPEAKMIAVLTHEDSVYYFIYSAVKSRRIADSIAADLGVWRWRVRGAAMKAFMPTAEIGFGGRVMAAGAAWPDSVNRPAISGDSALALGRGALQSRGWQIDKLKFIGDSTSTRGNRLDHLLRWDAGGPVLKGKDGAAAMHQVQVRIRGDTVGTYREALVLPASAMQSQDKGVVRIVAIILLSLVGCAISLFSFVLMMRRSRVDELQWRAMLVLTLACGVPALVYLAVTAAGGDSAGAAATSMFAVMMLCTVIGAFLLVPNVVGESLLAEHHPSSVAGLTDVSRGHLTAPELATAALIGYPAGLCLFALNGLIPIVGQLAGGTPSLSGTTTIMSVSGPALTPFSSLAAGFFTTLAATFVVGLCVSRRWPLKVALVAPAALMLIVVLSSNLEVATRVAVIVDTLAMSAILWRFGVFASIVMVFVQVSIEGLITLFVAGGTPGLMTALVAAVLVAAPGILGFAAFRQLKPAA
jgi:serine/threonine-protein kinase